jgi:lactoylglutathione lyase
MIKFNHFNFNVFNLDKSLEFYKQALNLTPVREKLGNGFKLVFLGDGVTDFTLELTYLYDRKEKYDLGECEFHLAFHTDEWETLKEKHKKMNCIAYENEAMGVYFITDPDGYWIEIVPER